MAAIHEAQAHLLDLLEKALHREVLRREDRDVVVGNERPHTSHDIVTLARAFANIGPAENDELAKRQGAVADKVLEALAVSDGSSVDALSLAQVHAYLDRRLVV
jgi:hypothetical protein